MMLMVRNRNAPRKNHNKQYSKWTARRITFIGMIIAVIIPLGIIIPFILTNQYNRQLLLFYHNNDDSNHYNIEWWIPLSDMLGTLNSTRTSESQPTPNEPPTQRTPFAYAFIICDYNPYSNDWNDNNDINTKSDGDDDNNESYNKTSSLSSSVSYSRKLLYNVLVNAYILRKEKTIADIVVYIQMSTQTTYDTLPLYEITVLEHMNIKYRYIPKDDTVPTTTDDSNHINDSNVKNYNHRMYNKLRVLSLIQYQRIIVVDPIHILLFHKLDYLFQLSTPTTANSTTTNATSNTQPNRVRLQKNFILSNDRSPVTDSLFMVSPSSSSSTTANSNDSHKFKKWKQVLDIIYKKELYYHHQNRNPENSNHSSKTFYFNETIGWGVERYSHTKNANPNKNDDDNNHDRMLIYQLPNGTSSRKWDFLQADSFPGLLYYYMKYYEKSVSIVLDHTIQNWNSITTTTNITTSRNTKKKRNIQKRKTLQLQETMDLDSLFNVSDDDDDYANKTSETQSIITNATTRNNNNVDNCWIDDGMHYYNNDLIELVCSQKNRYNRLYSDFIIFDTIISSSVLSISRSVPPWWQTNHPHAFLPNDTTLKQQQQRQSDDDDDNDTAENGGDHSLLYNQLWYTTLAMINETYNLGQPYDALLLSTMEEYDTNHNDNNNNNTRNNNPYAVIPSPDDIARTTFFSVLDYDFTTIATNTTSDSKANSTSTWYPRTSSHLSTEPKFAYAYVIGGCDPDNPAYRNYIYDVLISTYLQRMEGSQADVIIFFQISYNSQYDELPYDDDIRLLNAMNIQYRYIPKAVDESFYLIMLDKFRILELTQYDRVMFLDSDVMCYGSLDYLFHLSINGILMKNIIFAGHSEPASGGIFMLQPKEGDYDKIVDIIRNKELRGSNLPYPHWDEKIGWGHQLHYGEYFEDMYGTRSKAWTFHGSFTDQGLLYHWVKFNEKSVSIIMSNRTQNWNVPHNVNHGAILQETFDFDTLFLLISNFTTEIQQQNQKERPCYFPKRDKVCLPPHSDFLHFTGKSKPWLKGPSADFLLQRSNETAGNYWFNILSILNDELNIGLDFHNWTKHHRPLLGLYPKYKDVVNSTYRKSDTIQI